VHEGLPEDISVLEVVRSALSCFGEGEKVELLAGTTETVTVPRCDLAFIDGAHTRGWVRRDLAAILQRNPEALALLHDCALTSHGPEVRAGVLDFLTVSPGRRFRRFSGALGEVASEVGDEDAGTSGADALSLGLLYQPGREALVADFLEDPTLPWLQASARAAKLRGRVDKLKGRERRLRENKA
jgi:hypothetical protein